MRKLLRCLCGVVILLMVLVANPAWALEYGVYLAGDSTFSDTINLTLGVSGSANMGGSCGGICGLTGSLSYDGSKLELMAASGLQGFDFTQGGIIVLYKTVGASDGGILSLRFRNKGMAPGETATVSVDGIVLTNGDMEIGVGSASKTVQLIVDAPIEQPTGGNDWTGEDEKPSSPIYESASGDDGGASDSSQAEDELTDNKSVSSAKKSSNASLKQLTVNIDGLKFDKDILSYDLVVEREIESVTIGAQAEDSKANIDGAGEYALKYGINELKIIVRAEDGSEKEYIVKVYRDGANEAIEEYEGVVGGLRTALIVIISVVALAAIALFVIVFIKKRASRKNEGVVNQEDSAEALRSE